MESNEQSVEDRSKVLEELPAELHSNAMMVEKGATFVKRGLPEFLELKQQLQEFQLNIQCMEELLEEYSSYDLNNGVKLMLQALADAKFKTAYGPYTNGFEIGQNIFFVIDSNKKEDCQNCKGTKVVPANIPSNPEVKEIPCPACNGKGELHTWAYRTFQGVISSVDLKFKQDGKTDVRFTVSVRGSQTYGATLENLFITNEAAKKYADERNSSRKGRNGPDY